MLVAAWACSAVAQLPGSSPQPEEPNAVQVHAVINASSDFYSSNGIDPRQPGNTTRLIIRPTITLYDQFQIPLEIYLSTQVTRYQQPFNQFGVNPRIGNWLTLHGGYFSNYLSAYSFGDLRVYGGGFDLTPGKFRLSFLYGTGRQARGIDSLAHSHGEYQRVLWAGKIGYGAENGFHVHLNVVHGIDDSTSIAGDSATPAPAENLALSLSFGVPIASIIRVTGEVGVSGFSNDIRVAPVKGGDVVPAWLFVPRGSTQADGAGQLAIAVTPLPALSVKLGAKWVGPGFVTLGYAQMPNDVLEATIAPDVRLLRNSLYARASFGLRWNNLRNNRLSTTRRIIGSLSGGWSINDHVGFDVQYANYGMRSTHIADTQRIDNIYQLWSVAPRFMFEGWGAAHALMLNYSYQDLSDNNPSTADYTRNHTHTATVVHAMIFRSSWNSSSSVFFTYLGTAALISRILNVTESVGRSFLVNNRLSITGTIGYGIVSANANSNGQVIVRLSGGYTFEKYGSLTVNISNNAYNFANLGATRQNFSELQASVQYGLSL
jgi:hypothetical protein